MPRIRTIKPEFFRSPSTARASLHTRILFQAMWCWADDFGIGETNVYGLLGFAFPDDDELSVEDLQRFLEETHTAYEVEFYNCRGRSFYSIPSWDSHQKTERRAAKRNPGADDPDSTPDLRFMTQGNSSHLRGSTERTQGKTPLGTGEQGNRGTGEQNKPPYPPNVETLSRPAAKDGRGKALAVFGETNLTARSVGAYRIAEAFSQSLPTPIEGELLAGIGTQIDKCLNASIDPAAIAAGLKAWTASDSWSPTQIPNFVHKAANRAHSAAATVGKPTAKAVGWDDACNELLAELGA